MDARMDNDGYNDRYYHTYLWVFVIIFIAIPVAAFFLGNAWLSFGIIFFMLSSWIAWLLVPVLLLYAFYIWFTEGFNLAHPATFFLACSICGALLFYFARNKVLKKGDSEREES